MHLEMKMDFFNEIFIINWTSNSALKKGEFYCQKLFLFYLKIEQVFLLLLVFSKLLIQNFEKIR